MRSPLRRLTGLAISIALLIGLFPSAASAVGADAHLSVDAAEAPAPASALGTDILGSAVRLGLAAASPAAAVDGGAPQAGEPSTVPNSAREEPEIEATPETALSPSADEAPVSVGDVQNLPGDTDSWERNIINVSPVGGTIGYPGVWTFTGERAWDEARRETPVLLDGVEVARLPYIMPSQPREISVDVTFDSTPGPRTLEFVHDTATDGYNNTFIIVYIVAPVVVTSVVTTSPLPMIPGGDALRPGPNVEVRGTAAAGQRMYGYWNGVLFGEYQVGNSTGVRGVAEPFSLVIPSPTGVGSHELEFRYQDARHGNVRGYSTQVFFEYPPLRITSPAQSGSGPLGSVTVSATGAPGMDVVLASGHSSVKTSFNGDGMASADLLVPEVGLTKLTAESGDGKKTIQDYFVLGTPLTAWPATGDVVAGTVMFDVWGSPSQSVTYSVDGVEGGSFILAEGTTTQPVSLPDVGHREVSFRYTGLTPWYELHIADGGNAGAVSMRLAVVNPLVVDGADRTLTVAPGGTVTLTGTGAEAYVVRYAVDGQEAGSFRIANAPAGLDWVTPVAWTQTIATFEDAGAHEITLWYDKFPQEKVDIRVDVALDPLSVSVLPSAVSKSDVLAGAVPFVVSGSEGATVSYSVGGETRGSFTLAAGSTTQTVELPDTGGRTLRFWYDLAPEIGASITVQVVNRLTVLVDSARAVAGSTLRLEGTGAEAYTVRFAINGEDAGSLRIGNAPAGTDWRTPVAWSRSITVPEAPGEYTITLSYSNFVDSRVEVRVRATVMEPLVVDSPASGSQVVYGTVPTFTGVGVPGAEVRYRVGASDEVHSFVVPGADDGRAVQSWSQDIPMPLAVGWHTVTMWYADEPEVTVEVRVQVVLTPLVVSSPVDDGDVLPGEVPFVVTGTSGRLVWYSVDGGEAQGSFSLGYGPTTQLVDLPETGVRTVRFWYDTTPDQGSATVSVAVVDAVTITSPEAGSVRAQGVVDVSGTAFPSREVSYTVGEVSGTAVADEDGIWSVAVTLPAGDHVFAVNYTGGAAEFGTRVEFRTAVPLVVDSPVSGSQLVYGAVPTFTGVGVAGAEVRYRVGTSDEVHSFVIPGADDAQAVQSWSREVPIPLAVGWHTVTMWYADEPDVTVEVRVQVVLAPLVVSSPSADSDVVAGEVPFVLTGTGGRLVWYAVDGGEAQGSFSLGYGPTTQNVELMVSGRREVRFWYDTTPDQGSATVSLSVVQPVVVDDPTDGAWISGSRSVTFTGTAEPEATVAYELAEAGLFGEIAVDASGSWSVTVVLNGGEHAVEFALVIDGTRVQQSSVSHTVRLVPVGAAKVAVSAQARLVSAPQAQAGAVR